MNQPLAWVTGAGGLIGNYLVQAAAQQAADHRVVGLTRRELNLSDFAAVRQKFAHDQPRLVIHCAALSRSPECQANPPLARRLNVEVTALLADLAAEIPLVFFSTDLVFDGKSGNYDECAPVNPLSIYAETKVIAEQTVLSNPKHTVVRTSLNGGSSPTGDRGFNEQLRREIEAGKTLTLFTDEFRCPIAAIETARTLWLLVKANAPGLYHLAGRERLSRWEIGQVLTARWPHLHPKIVPSSAGNYPGAPRSLDPSLNCTKLENLLSIRLPGFTQWLAARPHELF